MGRDNLDMGTLLSEWYFAHPGAIQRAGVIIEQVEQGRIGRIAASPAEWQKVTARVSHRSPAGSRGPAGMLEKPSVVWPVWRRASFGSCCGRVKTMPSYRNLHHVGKQEVHAGAAPVNSTSLWRNDPQHVGHDVTTLFRMRSGENLQLVGAAVSEANKRGQPLLFEATQDGQKIVHPKTRLRSQTPGSAAGSRRRDRELGRTLFA